MPRTSDGQPNRVQPLDALGATARRSLRLGLIALATAPVALVVACGSATQQTTQDTRPEPNASTEGVRSVYPEPVEEQSRPPQVVPRSATQSQGTGKS